MAWRPSSSTGWRRSPPATSRCAATTTRSPATSARYDAAVRTIAEAGHDAALIVSHGAALRTWVSTRMAPHPDAPPPTEPLHNTALIVLEGDPDTGWEMVSWQGHPVGGAVLGGPSLEDPTAEDPTGDLDPDDDGEIG